MYSGVPFVMFSLEQFLYILKQYASFCGIWGCADGLLMCFHSMYLTVQYLEGALYILALIRHYWKSYMDCKGAKISSANFNESYKTTSLRQSDLFSLKWQKTFINTQWKLWLPPSRILASAKFSYLPSLQPQPSAEFSFQLNGLYEAYLHCMSERSSRAKAQLSRSCCLRSTELLDDGDCLRCDQKVCN